MRSAERMFWFGVMFLLVLAASCVLAAGPGAEDGGLPIKVLNPSHLPGEIKGVRTPLGLPGDDHPWIIRLKGGELLVVAFDHEDMATGPGGRFSERAVFWRSRDGGRTWEPREERKDLPGREFSPNRLPDGVLLMPCFLSSDDVSNQDGYGYSLLYRSADGGRTWSRERIGPEGFPPGGETVSDGSAIEVPDSQKPGRRMTILGVSMRNAGRRAPDYVYLWRSRDNGKRWDKTVIPDTGNWSDVDGFFSQSVTYCTPSGKLLHATHVDGKGPHWRLPGTELQQPTGDQGDRMMLWESTNSGFTWRRHRGSGVFGTYGETHPRFLKLRDGRLMLTFTASGHPVDGYPPGLRAVLSHDDGESWDFTHDRLIISYVNEGAGGSGFGNTVQLADDTLITVYSYRGKDAKSHVEIVHWSLSDQE